MDYKNKYSYRNNLKKNILKFNYIASIASPKNVIHSYTDE